MDVAACLSKVVAQAWAQS